MEQNRLLEDKTSDADAWQRAILRTRMLCLSIELALDCRGCGAPIALTAVAPAIRCPRCQRETLIPGERWTALLQGATGQAQQMVDNEQREMPHDSPEGLFRRVFRRGPPGCSACGAPLDPSPFCNVGGPAYGTCHACGRPILIRRLEAICAEVVAFVDEDPEVAFPSAPCREAQPVSVHCTQCGAALTVDGAARMVACAYCRTNVCVPDDVWSRLHPMRAVRPFHLVLDEARMSAAPAAFFFSCVYDAVTDDSGNLYLSGDLCPAGVLDDGLQDAWPAIWSLDAELNLRWVRPKEGIQDGSIALLSGARVVVFPPYGIEAQLLVFAQKDGTPLDAGAVPDLRGDADVHLDSDESLVVVSHLGTVKRYSPSGQEQPMFRKKRGLWGGLMEAFGSGAGSSYEATALPLPDGGLIEVRAEESKERVVVRYGPDGRKLRSAPLGVGTGFLCSARLMLDRAGRVYLHDRSNAQLLRIGEGAAEVLLPQRSELLELATLAVASGEGFHLFSEAGAIYRLDADARVVSCNDAARARERGKQMRRR